MDEEGELVLLCLGSQSMLLSAMDRDLHSRSAVSRLMAWQQVL
jgi:hypothetical protein